MTTLVEDDTEDDVRPTITLPALPGCVSAVREHVRVSLAAWQLEPLADIAVLLASELATNAVRHACGGRSFSVVLRRERDRPPPGVWIEVHDTDARLPHLVCPGDDDTHGRGLVLVEALADVWEAVPHTDGKCVRFRLAAQAPSVTEPA